MRGTRTIRTAALALVASAALASAALASAALAQTQAMIDADSTLEAHTTILAAQLRCAVCQGISIQESPSALAREMRAVVKEQLRDGRTPEEVKAYFVSKYGEWILLEPTPQGLNLLLYVLPGVLVVGGFIWIGVVVRRWSAVIEPPPPGASV